MKKIFIKFLLILGLASTTMYADNCTTWKWNNTPVEIDTCKRATGKSGYYVIKNLSNKNIKTCWVITYSDGSKSSRSCNSNIKVNGKSKGSCYSCGSKGVRSVEITKFKYLDGSNNNKYRDSSHKKKNTDYTNSSKKSTSVVGKWSLQVKNPNGNWTNESVILKNNGKATYIASNGESYLAKWNQRGNTVGVSVFGTRVHYNKNDPAIKITMNINGSKFTGKSFVPMADKTLKVKGKKIR